MLAVVYAALITDWSPERIAGILGAVIPLAVSLIGRFFGQAASDRAKALVAGVLSVVAGVAAVLAQADQVGVVSWLTTRSAGLALAVATITYLWGWKPIYQINSKLPPKVTS